MRLFRATPEGTEVQRRRVAKIELQKIAKTPPTGPDNYQNNIFETKVAPKMSREGLQKRVRTTVGNRATDLTQACVLDPRRRRPEDPPNRLSTYGAGSTRGVKFFRLYSTLEYNRKSYTGSGATTQEVGACV